MRTLEIKVTVSPEMINKLQTVPKARKILAHDLEAVILRAVSSPGPSLWKDVVVEVMDPTKVQIR